MEKHDYTFSYEVYESISQVGEEDAFLLQEARKITRQAYAPYSRFRVAAVAKMSGGAIIGGTNQENASFPAGICAERVLLSTASAVYPDQPLLSLAVSYDQEKGSNDHPIFPCGICRQSLVEYERRMNAPIRLILGGLSGKVFIISQAGLLLPLAFTSKDLT